MKKITVHSVFSDPRGILRTAVSLVLVLLGSAVSVRAAGSPPERMTYQGFLVDNNGAALAPTTPINYPVIFRIYSESEGSSSPIWSEQQIVTVDKGNFSVVLGEGTDVPGETRGLLSSIFLGTSASERYMGITVTISGNNLTLLPRLRMLPAPYSFLASQAVQLVNPSSGVPFMSLIGSEANIPGNSRFGGSLFWGSAAYLDPQQGGSIELGNSMLNNAVPFIDFHYGRGIFGFQDYNMRLINDADGRLSVYGGRLSFGNNIANTKIALWDNGGATYGMGIGNSQLRLHLDAPGARFSFLNTPSAGEVMTIQGNGNVGINAVSPSHKFEVHGPNEVAWFESSGANAYIRVSDNTGFDNRVEFASRGNGRAAIWSGDDHLNVLRNGRVGIGTIAPTVPLTIRTPDMAQARIEIQQGGNIAQFGRVETYAFVLLNNSHWSAANKWAAYDGDSNWDFLSDRKLKKDIIDGEPMLERALKVQVRRYRWKEDQADSKHKLGVIAQELQPLFPEMVTEMVDPSKPGEKNLSVGYGDFGVIAIKAIQELHKVVESKDARIASLEAEVAALKKQAAATSDTTAQWEARFAALEKMVAAAVPVNSAISGTELASQSR